MMRRRPGPTVRGASPFAAVRVGGQSSPCAARFFASDR